MYLQNVKLFCILSTNIYKQSNYFGNLNFSVMPGFLSFVLITNETLVTEPERNAGRLKTYV